MKINYSDAIDERCGIEYEVYKDIIITPFYKKEFCQELVSIAEFYKDRFAPNISYYYKGVNSNDSPWNTININQISVFLFQDFCNHYKKTICPLLEKIYLETKITGWFSPMIIKYENKGQELDLHHDESLVTMNCKLNDNYKGSILYFPRQDFSNKDIPVGTAYFWPSNVTHPHKTDQLQSGTKYTFTSWTFPPAWKKENFIENV